MRPTFIRCEMNWNVQQSTGSIKTSQYRIRKMIAIQFNSISLFGYEKQLKGHQNERTQ